MKNKKLITLALVTTLLSVAVHIYLTLHHYDVQFGISDGKAICNISEKINCDTVAASSYSTFLGVPMALFGALSNLILFLFLLVVRTNLTENPENSRTVVQVSAYFGMLIELVSILMAGISFLKLGAICLFCVSAYILSTLTFIAILIGAPQSFSLKHLPETIHGVFGGQKWILILFLMVPGLGFLINSMYKDGHQIAGLAERLPQVLADWESGTVYTFDLNRGLKVHEDLKQPVLTIVEFADFRCPHCKHAYPSLDAFVQSHPDIKMVFKVFALDATCNPSPKLEGHGDGISCELGFLTHCAESLAKKGWVAHHYIYDHQEDLRGMGKLDPLYDDLARVTGIKIEELKACTKASTSFEEMKFQGSEGQNAAVEGTPSVYINGKKLGAAPLLPILEAVYNKAKK